jgi:hypothetical protein
VVGYLRAVVDQIPVVVNQSARLVNPVRAVIGVVLMMAIYEIVAVKIGVAGMKQVLAMAGKRCGVPN